MNSEQLRNKRFDQTLDRVTKRERETFRQESLERRKAQQQEPQPPDRLEPVAPTQEKRVG